MGQNFGSIFLKKIYRIITCINSYILNNILLNKLIFD